MNLFRKLILSPDNSELLVYGNDRKLRIWNLGKRNSSPQVVSRLGNVTTVDFFGNDQQIAVGCKKKKCLIWDVATDAEQKSFNKHKAVINAATVAATSHHLAIANNKKVSIWSHLNSRKLNKLEFEYPIMSLFGSSQSKRFYINLGYKKIAVIPISDKSKSKYFSIPGRDKNVFAVSPNGRYITAAGRNMTTWDLKSKKSYNLRTYDSKIIAIAFFPDSKKMAVAYENGKTSIIRSKNHDNYSTITGNSIEITVMKVTPDGKRLVAGTRNNDLVLWDIKTGTKVFSEKAHRDPICSLDISADGKTICTTDGTEMKFWHAINWGINLTD